MQVFLCWSGESSHKIALALNEFLGDVIQDVRPFLSSESIRKGARWRNEIGKRLAETNYGILCLTRDNLKAPWILFEAGALSKNITEGHVTAFLAGIQPTDVIEPLSEFQSARNDRDDIWKMITELNALIPEPQQIDRIRLERAFAKHWPDFEKKVAEAMQAGIPSTPTPPRRTEDMISEILELVREMKRESNAASGPNLNWAYLSSLAAKPPAAFAVPIGGGLAGLGDVLAGTSASAAAAAALAEAEAAREATKLSALRGLAKAATHVDVKPEGKKPK